MNLSHFRLSPKSHLPTVVMIGAFDTKHDEYVELRSRLLSQGLAVLAVNIGIFKGHECCFPIDIDTNCFADAIGCDLQSLRDKRDRPLAMSQIKSGIVKVFPGLYKKWRFDGIIGMGGTNGTDLITAAMRCGLPFEMPKVCISTVAQHYNYEYTKQAGIVLFNPVTDISGGANRINSVVITQASAAISGMVKLFRSEKPRALDSKKPALAISQFGSSTPCVNRCAQYYKNRGYDVLVFHMVGTGGKAMEDLISKGQIDAVLDVTTTELADLYDGGVFSAGVNRLSAAGEKGIPQLIIPGCLDMTNLGRYEDVVQDAKYRNRRLIKCNEEVTIMRTRESEYGKISEHIISKLKRSKGPAAILIPGRGLSQFDRAERLDWYDEEANRFLFDQLRILAKEHCPSIEVVEVDHHLDDPEFADEAIRMMERLMKV